MGLPFEACSMFTRVTACSLADLSFSETFYIGGFSPSSPPRLLTATAGAKGAGWVYTLTQVLCLFIPALNYPG